MKNTIGLLFSSLLLTSGAIADPAPTVGTPNCDRVKGDWINELGSTLSIISVSEDQMLRGTYTSPSGTDGKSVPLIGWINYAGNTGADNLNVLSFSVNWTQYGSMTSWSGTCAYEKGEPVLRTLWHLTRTSSDFPWDHTLAGTDQFIPKE